ncbi:Serine/threonine-protein kinase C [Acaryochloris thomasi RCC1774]|uniref:non-specific serine/threonine protein kinase n=1 Tax=Acaryochloris thomasi RCC1774 TaxID=1764569 RepID=A0A2W1JL80_9CYAN|nr:protein kinase [Acaryochloris thomasi]PZD74119.1 Serine/threonine-protein kinase C [Acaryochloris thomasi RCC1774]
MSLKVLNNRYRLLRVLGQGGFGKTYLTEDTHLPSKSYCVIKELQPISGSKTAQNLVQERFKREASVLENLGQKHSQIPTLYAFFSERGMFYLVQEWVEGKTLTQKLQSEGLMKEKYIRNLTINILNIVDYIHSEGIIHRDIKPDNIIIRENDNKPILIDFGAVKEIMGIHLNTHGSINSSVRIGTPGFLPPEQAIGRPIPSSDLYSLGLTAIYLLSGKLPHDFPTDSSTGDILWQAHCPKLSPWLTSILDKAIKNHPPQRFASAQKMKNALQSKTTSISSLDANGSANGSNTVIQGTTSKRRLRSSPFFRGVFLGFGVLITLGSILVVSSPSLRLKFQEFFLPPPLPGNGDLAPNSDPPKDLPEQEVGLNQSGTPEPTTSENKPQAEVVGRGNLVNQENGVSERTAEQRRIEQEKAAAEQRRIEQERAAEQRRIEQEKEKREAEGRNYCIITITSGLVSLHSEPDPFSQEIIIVKPNDYYVISTTLRKTPISERRWLKIESGGRQGWIPDDSFTIDSKSEACS